MSSHSHATTERHCDVAVVDGTDAGLAGALQLVRRHRSVIVVDPGDGSTGAAVDGRAEVRRHGGEVLAGRVHAVTGDDAGRSRVELVGGNVIVARRVLDASRPGDVTDAVSAIDDALAEEDRRADAHRSSNQIDWDHRYGGDRMWSGNPNGTLVAEVADLPPGRALDVGAGEGGDAVWLAERGWVVTAADISTNALGRVKAEAERRGLDVECRQVDANDVDAFEPGAFDLVSAQYASIPRTPDDRAVRNLLGAVAPGGTLVVVGHDLEPMRAPIDTREHSRAFDPDAYVGPDDVAAALDGVAGWDVEVHEKRPRPPGSATAQHHVDDIVVRARRRS